MASGRTVSSGMPISEKSYSRLFSKICVGSMGKNGRNSEATAIDSMLPKLELAPMRTYLRMLTKVRRPSSTPSATTSKSDASRIMSAAAWATPLAPSTDSPMSATLSAGASLMPSPRNPTTAPCAWSARTRRAFWSGARRA